MNNETLIGKRRPAGNNGNYGKWFYLEANKDNIFRVLPPVHSLAAQGAYAKFHATHRWIRGTDGKPSKPFLCVEERDFKAKMTTRHCPLCDRVFELESMLKTGLDAGQVSKEQAQELRAAQIGPIKVDKKYYINVVNQEGNIGVLSISITMYKALEALFKQYDAKGTDLTGAEAPFLNFQVLTAYKGDPKPIHKVDVYLQPTADGGYRPVNHQLTADVINRMQTEARDLNNLFKSIDIESISTLAAADPKVRAEIIDRLFAAGEKTQEVEEDDPSMLDATIPGTNARAVAGITANAAGISVQAPVDLFKTAAMPVQPVQSPAVSQAQASKVPPPNATAGTAKPASAGLSNAEFMNLFAPKQG